MDPTSATSIMFGAWSNFHQNRPAWIVGVNGFAIQVLSSTTNFHCNPTNMEDTTRTNFSDSDVVWTVDGYDFCNRMSDFTIFNSENHIFSGDVMTDVIKLLRADGSVLALHNRYIPDGTGDPDMRSNDSLYTGYYYINEANAKGFAFVEFDDAIYPRFCARARCWVGSMRPMTCEPIVHEGGYFPGEMDSSTFFASGKLRTECIAMANRDIRLRKRRAGPDDILPG